jgi:hypothetical protein
MHVENVQGPWVSPFMIKYTIQPFAIAGAAIAGMHADYTAGLTAGLIRLQPHISNRLPGNAEQHCYACMHGCMHATHGMHLAAVYALSADIQIAWYRPCSSAPR